MFLSLHFPCSPLEQVAYVLLHGPQMRFGTGQGAEAATTHFFASTLFLKAYIIEEILLDTWVGEGDMLGGGFLRLRKDSWSLGKSQKSVGSGAAETPVRHWIVMNPE